MTTIKNTSKLAIGDTVIHYSNELEVVSIKQWKDRETGEPVYSCKAKCVKWHESIPKGWFDHENGEMFWKIQGNKLAKWHVK